MTPIDPDAIHAARDALIARDGGGAWRRDLRSSTRALNRTAPFSPDAASAGRRALRNAALRFLTARRRRSGRRAGARALRAATNMTDMIAGPGRADAHGRRAGARPRSPHFHDRFKDDPLVLDKWMGLQAMSPQPDTVDARARADEAPGLHAEEPEPRAFAGGRVCRRQSAAVPRPLGRGLSRCCAKWCWRSTPSIRRRRRA